MSRNGKRNEVRVNSARDWLMLVPVTVFACCAVMVVGAVAMIKWAAGAAWELRPRMKG